MKDSKEQETTFYKKWWFWVIIVIVLIIGVSGDKPHNDTNHTEEVVENIHEEKEDILHIDNHPVLYDDGIEAKKFALSYDEIITDTKSFKSGKTRMVLISYGLAGGDKDSLLHEIELYPEESLSFEDGLELAKEYLPMDIIEDHYIQEWSKKYCLTENGSQMYAQLYKPENRQSDWFKNNKKSYNYVLLFLNIKDKRVSNIVLRTTNSLPNTDKNCESTHWDYSIL